MNLEPWGRIEGTFVSNGQPLAGRTISIAYGPGGGLDTVSCNSGMFGNITDSQGRFTLDRVPLGNHKVALVAPFTNQMGQVGSATIPLQPITITPGTTNTITVDIANLNLPDFILKKYGLDGAN